MLLKVQIFLLVIWIFLHHGKSSIVAFNKYNMSEEFKDKDADFGPTIDENGMEGLLVKATPYDACSPIKSRNEITGNSTLNIFVLIQRGNCSFEDKILNAQNANYDAVIVCNNDSEFLMTMESDNDKKSQQIYIPSVFVGETSGYILKTFYLFDSNMKPILMLYANVKFDLDDFLIALCGMMGSAAFCMMMFVIFRVSHNRRRVRRNRLSDERVSRLPTKKFCKGDKCDVCAICLDDYEEGECLRVLPCKHAYHCNCVDPWLTRARRVCPLCKRKVLSDDDSDYSLFNEQSHLLQNTSAASPNASRYATGFTGRNPFRSYSWSSEENTESESSVAQVEEETASGLPESLERVVISRAANQNEAFSETSSFENAVSARLSMETQAPPAYVSQSPSEATQSSSAADVTVNQNVMEEAVPTENDVIGEATTVRIQPEVHVLNPDDAPIHT